MNRIPRGQKCGNYVAWLPDRQREVPCVKDQDHSHEARLEDLQKDKLRTLVVSGSFTVKSYKNCGGFEF